MAEIQVTSIDQDHFEVIVTAKTTTSHHVTLNDGYYAKLSNQKMDKSALIKASFDFLLARESNASILRSFDLSVISHYFPEYEQTIKR